MPTLFISYKRGTSAVAPLMQALQQEHYRLWFDREEIHLGDTDWQARIDEGLRQCDGVILNITPAACESEPVQYEVKRAIEFGKPIFPVMLERTDYNEAINKLGLAERQHIEEFLDVEEWDAQVERFLRDLQAQGLRVTRHEKRERRDPDNPSYILHQRYLRKVTERVGTLDLAKINPDGKRGIYLEDIYIDSPTGLSISAEVNNWQVMDWWIQPVGKQGSDDSDKATRPSPQSLGFQPEPLETLISSIDQQIAEYRKKNPDKKPDEEYSWRNDWNNGTKKNIINLQLQHIAASTDRLVILGAPGSGKSTFVRHLTLCLAGAGLNDWARDADLSQLEAWTHGRLTPIYIELRRFVTSTHFPSNIDTMPTTDHLWQYIKTEILGEELADYTDDLFYDLQQGHAVIVLDGLDEVPYPEGELSKRQAQLSALASSIHSNFAGCRVIVASRPYAYEGWKLANYTDVTIAAFEDKHRIALASALYCSAGMSLEDAQQKAQALNNNLKPIDPELKDRPLFVTLMAIIYLRGDSEGLPTRRGALYRESILLLLERWTSAKSDMPSLVDLLGDKTLDDLYKRLSELAYDVHNTYGEQPDTPEIDEMLLYKHLKPLGRTTAAELIPYLSENAGVLVSPGQNDKSDVFHFAHRTFQEYLAASQLADDCLKADSFTQLANHITEKPQIWRVPGVLVGDVLADTDRRGDLWELIEDLLDDEALDNATGDSSLWWRVWLAATIAREQGLCEAENLRRSERSVRELLVERLIQVSETAQALDPVERADCGLVLGLLGDTRKGVGVEDGLPDIDWIHIPDDGEWTYQDKKRVGLGGYDISKYPITYAQFQCFVDAKDGLYSENHNWFEGLHEDAKKYGLNEQRFKYNNHPRETVNWYQAMAFCRWWSWKLRPNDFEMMNVETWVVRLPTEFEWEKAARGTDGREYPYEGDFDSSKDNTRETSISKTSAVGIFQEGASPYGVLDMSGNVNEWCLTDYSNPAEHPSLENISSDSNRVLRGGSWFYGDDDARAAYRFRCLPYIRGNHLGFRVVRPPSL